MVTRKMNKNKITKNSSHLAEERPTSTQVNVADHWVIHQLFSTSSTHTTHSVDQNKHEKKEPFHCFQLFLLTSLSLSTPMDTQQTISIGRKLVFTFRRMRWLFLYSPVFNSLTLFLSVCLSSDLFSCYWCC